MASFLNLSINCHRYALFAANNQMFFLRILTIKEKESIEKGLWQQEKYFDDILCMRIPGKEYF